MFLLKLENVLARLMSTPVGQEKYYVFLICSQEKHLHSQGKSQEKSGKIIRQDVYEP